MTFVPATVSELCDHLGWMALAAPEYTLFDGQIGDPAGAFQTTALALANVKRKIGVTAYSYLLARTEENWERLQTNDLGSLALSFGEMAHFLRVKQYKRPALEFAHLGKHTDVVASEALQSP